MLCATPELEPMFTTAVRDIAMIPTLQLSKQRLEVLCSLLRATQLVSILF